MDVDTLARQSGEVLKQRQLALATAESCTGGLLATHITNVPGSSAYFRGAIVAYANELKHQLLGVPQSVLVQHGAVSRETALAMAAGARGLLNADLALAITGVAGPSGGSPEKPVGLVYVALAAPDVQQCRECHWSGDRWQNREWSAQEALSLLLQHLLQPPPQTEPLRSRQGVAVSVDARFDLQGQLVPRAFQWRGQWLHVSATGRIWETSRGGVVVRHYLVSTPGEILFDISYEPVSARWYARLSGRRPLVV